MSADRIKRRMKAGCAAIALMALAAPLAFIDMPQASAQAMMRVTPNLNVQPRIPTVNPTIAPRVDPNIAARANTVTSVDRVTSHVIPTTTTLRIGRLNPNSTMPYARFSPNLYPVCDAAHRDGDGECKGTPAASGDGGNGKSAKGKGKGKGPNSNAPTTISLAFPNQLVAELDAALSEEQIRDIARRGGMELVEYQKFPLIEATIGLFRITDGHPLDAKRREFGTLAGVRNVQFNWRYWLQQSKPLTEGDPAQYAVAKLKLPQAHTLAHGMNVTIAVIDSGIDGSHPELANTISDNFDALGSTEGAHVHGTGIAGAIAAHGRLMGSAPEARIIAIRAFGSAPGGAESSSYVIIKSLNYAVLHGAQVINMSFAGPRDVLIERGIAATAARDVVLVAAAGNAGPKSPPLFPAANPNVIAVSGTDAQDRLFQASNRGVAYRAGGARHRRVPAGAGPEVPDDLGHLVLGGLCVGHRRVAARAQPRIEAERSARDPHIDRPRPRPARQGRAVRLWRGGCLCGDDGSRHRAVRSDGCRAAQARRRGCIRRQ